MLEDIVTVDEDKTTKLLLISLGLEGFVDVEWF